MKLASITAAIFLASSLLLYSGAGSAFAATFNGTAGNDSIYGTDGPDQIWGKDGNDSLDGGFGSDVIGGDNGDDTLQLAAGAGETDIAYGGAGNDQFIASGGSGTSVMIGDAGDDTITWGGNSAPGGGQIFAYGGDGADKINIWAYPATHAFAIATGDAGNDVITTQVHGNYYGGADNDIIDARNSNDNVIEVGDSGDDTLYGSPYSDLLYGGDGNDNLYGSGGADYFNCGPGYDVIHGFDPYSGDVKTADCEATVP